MFDHLTTKLSLVAASGIGLLAAAENIDGLPAWVERLGVPVAFLGLTLYAMKFVFLKYVSAIDARLQDKDDFAALLVEQADKASESREMKLK